MEYGVGATLTQFQLKNNDSINSKSIKINQVKKQDLSIEQSKNLSSTHLKHMLVLLT